MPGIDDLFAGLAGGFGGVQNEMRYKDAQSEKEKQRQHEARMEQLKAEIDKTVAEIRANADVKVGSGHDATAVATTGMETGSREKIATADIAQRDRASELDATTRREGFKWDFDLGKYRADSDLAGTKYGANAGMTNARVAAGASMHNADTGAAADNNRTDESARQFDLSFPLNRYKIEMDTRFPPTRGAGGGLGLLTGADGTAPVAPSPPSFDQWQSTASRSLFPAAPRPVYGAQQAPLSAGFQQPAPSPAFAVPGGMHGEQDPKATAKAQLAAMMAQPRPTDPQQRAAMLAKMKELTAIAYGGQ